MNQTLEERFSQGTLPTNLDGFYKGKLLKINTQSLVNSLAQFIAQIWFPWRGKTFYSKTRTGDNLILNKSKYPFRTYKSKGIRNNINVLALDYNLPQNNADIRKVIDELVCVEKDKYLGKVYVVKGKSIKFAAFFSLEK